MTAEASAGTIVLLVTFGSTRLSGSGAVVAKATGSGSVVGSTFESEFLTSALSCSSCEFSDFTILGESSSAYR